MWPTDYTRLSDTDEITKKIERDNTRIPKCEWKETNLEVMIGVYILDLAQVESPDGDPNNVTEDMEHEQQEVNI